MKKILIIFTIMIAVFLSGCVPIQNPTCGNSICEEGEAIRCLKDCPHIEQEIEEAEEALEEMEEVTEDVVEEIEDVVEAITENLETSPESCRMPAGIACLDFTGTTRTITLILQNLAGYEIGHIFVNLEGEVTSQCEGPISLAEGETGTYTCQGDFSETKIKARILLRYWNMQTMIKHLKIGELIVKIMPESVCIDYDGGENVYIKSSARGTSPVDGQLKTVMDECQSSEVLNEAFCSPAHVGYRQHTCLQRCEDGKCVLEGEVNDILQEGDTRNYILGGETYFVVAEYIGNNQVVLTVNGFATEMIDEGMSVVTPSSLKITAVDIFEYPATTGQPDAVQLKIEESGNLTPTKAPIEGIQDILEEGETKTYTIEGKDYDVIVEYIGGATSSVKFNVNGEVTDTLREGESIEIVGGRTIFVVSIMENEAGENTGGDKVEFVFK